MGILLDTQLPVQVPVYVHTIFMGRRDSDSLVCWLCSLLKELISAAALERETNVVDKYMALVKPIIGVLCMYSAKRHCMPARLLQLYLHLWCCTRSVSFTGRRWNFQIYCAGAL